MTAFRFLNSAVAMLSFAAILLANTAQGADIAWHKKMPDAIRESVRQQKPMLIVVEAQWCGYCHKMLDETFRNPAVTTRIKARFVPVLIDADEQAALVETLNVESLPTVLVMAPDRRIIGRLTGFQSAAQLDARLASFKPTAPKSNPTPSLAPASRASNTLAAAKQVSSGR